MRATFINSAGGCHVDDFILWNQKGADSGSFLFAGMARSYIYSMASSAMPRML